MSVLELARGDKRYSHLFMGRDPGRMLAILFGHPGGNGKALAAPRLEFPPRPAPDRDEAAKEVCLAFLAARARLAEIDPNNCDLDELRAASEAVRACKAEVVSRLIGRSRVTKTGRVRYRPITVPGWRFSLDENDALHVCRVVPKARSRAPYLIRRFDV